MNSKHIFISYLYSYTILHVLTSIYIFRFINSCIDRNGRIHVTRPLVLYVCFVDCCVSFCTFSVGHCDVCSSIYGFWLPLCNFKHFLLTSHDLIFELLTISSANIWKLSGLELKHIWFQQELIFIEKYCTNIPERKR